MSVIPAFCNREIVCSISGLLSIGIMAAGLYFVKGVNEVPCPPISKTALVTLIPVPIETI